MDSLDRINQLAEWILRDSNERDKVTMYAQEIQRRVGMCQNEVEELNQLGDSTTEAVAHVYRQITADGVGRRSLWDGRLRWMIGCPECGRPAPGCWHPETEEVNGVEMTIEHALTLARDMGEYLMDQADDMQNVIEELEEMKRDES